MNDGTKKKLLTGGSLTAILVLLVVGVVVVRHPPGGSASSPPPSSESIKAIQSICQPTNYKQTCINTLTAASASNTTDPSELIKLSFTATIDKIRAVLNQSAVFKEAATDPRTKHALDNCEELLDYAIDDLKSSVDQLGDLNGLAKVNKAVEDLKVWLSAALTYEETCLDGFENATGDSGAAMRNAMNVSMELTHNALAIVDDVSSLFSSLGLSSSVGRRLLYSKEEGLVPRWVDGGRRRLMKAKSGGTAAVPPPHIVVAKDGSGNYTTIGEALFAVPKKSPQITVMYIKEGVYEENVQVNRSFINLVMIGDGADKTRITGSLNFVDGTPTFKTATVAVIGDKFMAKNIAFENTAGAIKHQAVALRVQADKSIFYNCTMDGYQDTLYAHTKRQFYRDCNISGTIDFVFGNSPVILQNCVFKVRKPLDNQQTIVTAQGRKDQREPTGIILQNCTITAAEELFPFRKKFKSYLGRPWKEFSRTLVMQSKIDDVIDPQGWLPWFGEFGLSTCFYSEFDNRGDGAGLTKRATWQGVKKIDYKQATKFTVGSFIQGISWLKHSGVPYYDKLLPLGQANGPVAGGPSP